MFTNILAPITPSASCERAADAAIALAERFGAAITLLHVHGFEHRWGEAELLVPPAELDSIRMSIAKHYAQRLEGLARHPVLVEQGVPHVEILRLARELGVDLIVMCPHRKELPSMPKPLWNTVGNTTERVISLAHCPVMLISRSHSKDLVLRSLLACTGLEVKDEFCIDYAAHLARLAGAKLTVFNVIDTDTPDGNVTQAKLVDIIEEREERMSSEYAGMVKGVADVDYHCVEGRVVVEILKKARTIAADLIVMAQLGGEEEFDGAFELSTVIHVADAALCPVMSVNRQIRLSPSSA